MACSIYCFSALRSGLCGEIEEATCEVQDRSLNSREILEMQQVEFHVDILSSVSSILGRDLAGMRNS